MGCVTPRVSPSVNSRPIVVQSPSRVWLSVTPWTIAHQASQPFINLPEFAQIHVHGVSDMILVHFLGKPFNISVIQVYAPTTNTEQDEVEWFWEDLQDLLEHQKKMSFLS